MVQQCERVSGTEILSLTDVQRRHAGNYQCRAQTHFVPATGGAQVTREGHESARVDIQCKSCYGPDRFAQSFFECSEVLSVFLLLQIVPAQPTSTLSP